MNHEVRNQFHREQVGRTELIESSLMKAFAKLIVEENDGHWTAWFKDVPQVAMGGEFPSDAIRRLLEHLGEENFDAEGIVAVEDGTRDGHLEFMIPLVGYWRIPVPSVN